MKNIKLEIRQEPTANKAAAAWLEGLLAEFEKRLEFFDTEGIHADVYVNARASARQAEIYITVACDNDVFKRKIDKVANTFRGIKTFNDAGDAA